MSQDDEDYKTGYRKPPRKSQFQPGQSGNRAGRPKNSERQEFGSDWLLELLKKQMRKKVAVREGNTSKKITMDVVMVHQLVADAAKGKIKSIFAIADYLQGKSKKKSLREKKLEKEVEKLEEQLKDQLGDIPTGPITEEERERLLAESGDKILALFKQVAERVHPGSTDDNEDYSI